MFYFRIRSLYNPTINSKVTVSITHFNDRFSMTWHEDILILEEWHRLLFTVITDIHMGRVIAIVVIYRMDMTKRH